MKLLLICCTTPAACADAGCPAAAAAVLPQTCDTNAFCKRNRGVPTQYSVVPGSIKVVGHSLSASLANKAVPDVQFNLTLRAYGPIVRLIVDELPSQAHAARYQIPDILMPGVDAAATPWDRAAAGAKEWVGQVSSWHGVGASSMQQHAGMLIRVRGSCRGAWCTRSGASASRGGARARCRPTSPSLLLARCLCCARTDWQRDRQADAGDVQAGGAGGRHAGAHLQQPQHVQHRARAHQEGAYA